MQNVKLPAGSLAEPNRDEKDLYRKIRKALQYLEINPRHPGLKSHEIDVLTEEYGVRIWESYLENKRSGELRMFWIYGPETKEITIVGIKNHPEPGRGFARVKLAESAIKKTIKKRKRPHESHLSQSTPINETVIQDSSLPLPRFVHLCRIGVGCDD